MNSRNDIYPDTDYEPRGPTIEDVEEYRRREDEAVRERKDEGLIARSLMLDNNGRAYLYDGVYVEHDGYGLKIMANSHDNPTDTIYLEPRTVKLLQKVFDEVYPNEKAARKVEKECY